VTTARAAAATVTVALAVAQGPVEFAHGCVFKGAVSVVNKAAERKRLPAGVYADTTIEL
jgi:hypothetical protein